ncbi:hypothetical protein LJC53_00180 [Bacteroidales bacterium OttesenSCG-928-C03]|nr:hypothetical protein [Bacteroidales bacterium OttesenSCG-928-C03]MDL2325528.1 hypothetical protein [Bacteroidales bacterium OttesenSCG-928-A14]
MKAETGESIESIMKIRELHTDREIREFVKFPQKLYKYTPYYVPSLLKEDIFTLTRHPALEFCERRLWLAFREDRIVGRIAGIINHRANELRGEQRIRFGWFDVENDPEAAQALLQQVEQWGKEQGLVIVSGPSRYSNMEKQGVLIDGFGEMPSLSCEYNHPYYPQLLELLNYQKEVDYLQYKIPVGEIPKRMEQLSKRIAERYDITLKNFNSKKELLHFARQFFLAMNESFQHIYNFIPLTDSEIDYLIEHNFAIVDKDLVGVLVDQNDEIVGFSLSMPSLNRAFKKADGRLFPFGWLPVLRSLRKNDSVDLILTGVLPEWIPKGIHAVYHYHLHKMFIEKGFRYAITNQQLEDLTASRIWEKYNGEVVARRRCYCKVI